MTDPTRTPDAEALLAAVCADPDADTPRLVYADWLDEHGDEVWQARAAFIREQVRIAAGQPPLDPAPPGWQSADALLFQYHEKWAADIPGWLLVSTPNGLRSHDLPDYRRGFVDRVRLHHDQWMSGLGEARPRVPVTRLSLWNADITRVAEVPQFATVRGFAPSSDRPATAEQVAAFVANPAVRGLRALNIGVERQAVRELARAANLARLTTLNIIGHPETVALLEPGSALAGLTELCLWTPGGLSNDTVRRLAESPGLARLSRLELPAGDFGVTALARSPLIAGLRALVLRWHQIGEPAVRALTESPHLGGLTELAVRPGRRVPRAAITALRRRFPFVEVR